jgi:hypothetical protein
MGDAIAPLPHRRTTVEQFLGALENQDRADDLIQGEMKVA